MNKILKLFEDNWRSLSAVVFLLGVWQILVDVGWLDQMFVSSPAKVISSLFRLLASADFASDFFYSLSSIIFGLILALAVGVSVGLLIGFNKKANQFLKFYIFSLSSLPLVALGPLVVVWFGLGIASKIFFAFIMAVIPVILSVKEGVKNLEVDLLKMGRSFGAGKFVLFKTIIIFNLLPFILSGLEIATGRTIVGVVIAELFGYGHGLGYLVSYYGGTFQVANLMAVIIVLTSINLLLLGSIRLVERKLVKW